MARALWCGEETYAAAGRIIERGLSRDGSLFSDDASIWTLKLAEMLDGRVGARDPSEGTFISKLEGQLDGLEPDAVQLAAELLYVELLGENDTGGPKKEEHVDHVLGLVAGTVAMPEELRRALHTGGVASYGAGKSLRDAFMRFLVRMVVAWKSLDPDERDRRLADPWGFLEFMDGLRTSTDAMQANALLHLMFPDTFEYMISPDHRARLIAAFAGAPGVAEADGPERKIEAIRRAASKSLSRPLELYDEPSFHRIWSEEPSPQWFELVSWAARLYERPDYDKDERDYKLAVAEKVAAARTAMEAGSSDWLEQLKGAFKDRRNNLTDWRAHGKFLDWCEQNPEQAKKALEELWRSDTGTGLTAFLKLLPKDPASGTGARLTLATFLLLGTDPGGAPFFKWTVYTGFRKVLGLPQDGRPDLMVDSHGVYRPERLAFVLGVDGKRIRRFLREAYPRYEKEVGTEWILNAEQAQSVVDRFAEAEDADVATGVFAEWVGLLEELHLRLLARGVVLRDLLDAQGIAYWIAKGSAPDDWDPEDRAAFERFCDPSEPEPESSPSEPVRRVGLPAATVELAERTYLPQEWLQAKVIDLLAEKKQLIFYGPPGTGKTFVAREVAEHIRGVDGRARLVQFHPSYTYEDFFEGYRPTEADRTVRFELVAGPLRELAEEARSNPDRPHLLVVDEINRGNIAKVFGELYFLLEYRDAEIELQYSRGEPFRLPENIYVIGTMNTADRSIALVDSALRRRFYFVGFVPTKDPIDNVLPRWLEANGLDPEPAVLLEALNEAIDDEDFSIGASYLMTSDGSTPKLEQVWEHAIQPILEEHFYGSRRDIAAEFGIEALRRRVAEEADAMTSEGNADEPAD